MDERVRTGVTLVFREIEPDASTRYRNEPREARFELVLPLLVESQSLVPHHGTRRVLHIENRDDFFVHATQPIALERTAVRRHDRQPGRSPARAARASQGRR